MRPLFGVQPPPATFAMNTCSSTSPIGVEPIRGPPGLCPAAPSTPPARSTHHTFEGFAKTPSKRRRERMIRLAEINAAAEIAKYETGCQTQPTNIEARLDELTAAFKSTTLEIKDEFSQKFSSVDQKMNLVLSTISRLSLGERSPSPKPASTSKESVHPDNHEEDAPDEDDLDRVFCSTHMSKVIICMPVFLPVA